MIATRKVASQKEFEDLLDASRDALLTTLAVGASLSNQQFEDSVLKAMCLKAQNTPFDNEIKQTVPMAFPDIVVSEYYGVEVKQTSKNKFVTTGNSIFEQTRHESVEDIYIMMCKTGDGIDVRWAPYGESIDNVIITHSPRYVVNLENSGIPVFQKMGTSYDSFRKLPTDNKMELVRKLYGGSDNNTSRQLWWLTKAPAKLYRLYKDLGAEERDTLRASMMFVCPEMFGSGQKKYTGATIYALSQGCIIPNVRDLFSAGGQVTIGGKFYPRIFGTASNLKNLIQEQCNKVDEELLKDFWGITIPAQANRRWGVWIDRVNHFSSPHNILEIIG